MKIKHLVIVLSIIVVGTSGVFLSLYYKKVSLFDKLPILSLNRNINEIQALYSFGNGEGNYLQQPLDIEIDSKGKSFVLDSKAQEVKVYDLNGKLLYSFGKGGEKKESLIAPSAIAFHDGFVLVSEPAVGRIQAFSYEGEFVKTYFATPYNEKYSPVGMVSLDNQTLLFTDVAKHRIVEIDSTGKVISTFGKPGAKEGEFAYPQDITIDKNKQIYVADSNNGRVQVFNQAREYVLTIDGTKSNKEKMSLPRGIAIDSLNRLIVVDTLANQIRFFELTGEPIFEYGEHGVEDGQLNFPNGISLFGKKIYVVDRENQRVQVFQ